MARGFRTKGEWMNEEMLAYAAYRVYVAAKKAADESYEIYEYLAKKAKDNSAYSYAQASLNTHAEIELQTNSKFINEDKLK